MGVFKEIEKADGSGVTTFYRLSDVHDTVETDDSEGTATVIDYNAAQNKPSVNGVALVGNKTSEDLGLQPAGDYITNDEADAKFIDEDELEAKNYVNETRLQEAIANIDHFHREIVNALPVTGQDNVLYMVRKQGSGEDIFNEYVWVGKTASETGYEFIGTTSTDLSDYYQKEEVDALLNNKVDKVNGKGLSDQNYTLAEKNKLAGLSNYDDSELRAAVAALHNYDDTEIRGDISDLEDDISTINVSLDNVIASDENKITDIRLVKSGDNWSWQNVNGDTLTFAQAQEALGHEDTILLIEDIENDGKYSPIFYRSYGTYLLIEYENENKDVIVVNAGATYSYSNLGKNAKYKGITTSNPASGNMGDIIIDRDSQLVYIYNGSTWVPFDKGGEVDLSNYLAKDNTTAWAPTGAFNPATKKYVDDSINGVFVPTKTSQLTNDSNFIGKNSNDLTYYYTKSQTYTKSEVEALIHGGGGGDAGLNGTQLNADCAIDDLINNDTETFYYIGDNEIELTVPIVSDSSHTITMTKDSFILIDRSGVYITLVTGGGGVYVFWKDTDSQNFYNGGYTLTEEDAYFKRDTYSKQEVNAIISSPEIWNWASTTTRGARADKSKASGIYGNYKSYSLFPTITLNASKYSDEYSGFYYFKSNTVESGAGEIIFSSSNEMDNTELYFTIANNLVSTVGLRPGNSVAGFIPFYDSGYYMTPTNWTVVGELPEYPNSTTLYFVSPDYYEQYINTSVTSNGFNSGVTWSHITNLFMKTDDHTNIVETWQNTAPNSGSQSTRWQVHAPKYNVAVGATPNFTNSNSEDLYMHGVLEQRDPQTTALRYSAYLNVESNLASGTTYYFDSDDYDTPTVGGAIPIYIPGSTSFFYTIGTNGGLACLKGDTPIKTKGSKTKQIKNIEVGDVVTDAEGNGTEVIKIYKHTIPETYNITLSNGDTLVASPCHKFSIKGRYRYACQVVKDHKLDRGDGSTFDVIATEVKQEEMEVYEILTESGTYTLGNGIICECEAI